MLDFEKIIKERQECPIYAENKDLLIDKILEENSSVEFALLTLGALQKNIDEVLKKKEIDLIVQIPSPFINTSISFLIVHFSKQKNKSFLTGIFKGKISENNKNTVNQRELRSSWVAYKDITEDFKNLLTNINSFLNNGKVEREDLNIVGINEFNKENISPRYYTKQAIKIRKELQESDYELLSEFADIITTPDEKEIEGKFIDSTNMSYPFVYSNVKKGIIKRAIKVYKGDIIALLIGEEPKFYLFNENYTDLYIKAGNYCLIRCRNSKNTSYLVNYLNDEKARFYFSTTVKGAYIPHLTQNDLKKLKVIKPDSQMLEIANKTQEYIMNQKKYTPYEINEIIRKSYDLSYKNESQKMISEDIVNSISSIKIKVLKDLISDDLNEVKICFDNGAYKSAIILCGSILEAVLLDWLSEFENTENVLNVAKNDDGRDMELNKIINRLKEIIKPYWYEATKANEIRKTRNMVHPKECLRNNKKVTHEECEKIIEDLKDIIDSKEKRHNG